MDMSITGCFGPPTADGVLAWILLPLVIYAAHAAIRMLSLGMVHLVALVADLGAG